MSETKLTHTTGAAVGDGQADNASDSGYSASASEYEPSVYTDSLTSSITAYRYEHGRRYNAGGGYDLPNDEEEQERMDLQYHALRVAFGDKLYFAPITNKPSHIIDIGTGTGIWPMDLADVLPNTEIIGTDLSPIQPGWVPPNVKFEIDDAEQSWTFSEDHFDLVHTRIMNAFLKDWDRFLSHAYRHLKPGGWVELQELSVDVRSDDGSLAEDSYFRRWYQNEEKAWNTMGLSVTLTGEEIRGWLEKAGFVNIEVKTFKLPVGLWSDDPKLREVGSFQLVAMLEGIHGLTAKPWIDRLGWDPKDVEVYLDELRKEFKNKNIHAYFPLYAVYGQKPSA